MSLPNDSMRSARMLVAQPTQELPEAPYAAVVARPLAVWPFATRTLRLCVLIDPSQPDPTPRHGLLRAMQQAYFCSDGCSQTRAVREAALAAHYVLRHYNRDTLPVRHVNAATAVAALRGDTAVVALAGDAAVFAWRDGVLTGQRGVLRLPRPLGLEQDPRITLWSTRLKPRDRLLLVCGAAWRPDSQKLIEDLFRDPAPDADDLQDQISAVLSGTQPAGVLLIDPESRPARHLALVDARDPGQSRTKMAATRQVASGARVQTTMRWLSRLLGLALLGAAVLAALGASADQPSRAARLHDAQALLAQADAASDAATARAFAASALDLAGQGPSGEVDGVVAEAASKLAEIDHIYPVSPAMAVRLGPSGANVMDLAVGDDTLYTLDVVEASVRAFALDGHDQQPMPDTLLVRAGAPVMSSARPLATPVAIQYLAAARSEPGALAIVDQTRAVVQVDRDRSLHSRAFASSASWGELGALGADTGGSLYVLDSGSRRVLAYPPLGQPQADSPRLLLDAATVPGLALERAAEILGQHEDVYLRMDDGTLRRFDTQGQEKDFAVRAPEGTLSRVSAVAADPLGGLYVVDAARARVLQTTADGAVVRQLSDPALAGVRQIRSSLDGRRLYGLVTSGVLVFDVPAEASDLV